MKANWKIALMCFATLAFVACKDKKEAEDPGKSLFDYNPPIEVNDHSVSDWDDLDQTKVAVSDLTAATPLYTALKQIKVYADSVCIFFQLTFDPAEMQSHTSADDMHIYFNADNSDLTGGFFDLFAPKFKGDVDFMFEVHIWDDNGAESFAVNYEYWSGAVNGEGWEWTPNESVSPKVSTMQFVGDNIIEGRLVRELIPFAFNEDGFEVGFDIQQNWENVGLLPQESTVDGQEVGRAKKLYVAFDK